MRGLLPERRARVVGGGVGAPDSQRARPRDPPLEGARSRRGRLRLDKLDPLLPGGERMTPTFPALALPLSRARGHPVLHKPARPGRPFVHTAAEGGSEGAQPQALQEEGVGVREEPAHLALSERHLGAPGRGADSCPGWAGDIGVSNLSLELASPPAELSHLGTKTMQQATQLQVSPSGQSSYQPVPNLQDKAGILRPQPWHEPPASKETLLQKPDKDKTAAHHIPCLRAVVERQAFENVLVDEMDMMLFHAATLIQANWRGYQLRQRLISQMMATKAIQEAWRRFNTRCLLQSGKAVEKKAKVEEGDIPYHPPQQVRFQHPEEDKSLLAQPTMVSKETQFPSSNSLATYTHQLALLQAQGMSQPGTCSVGGPSVAFLPHQTVAIRLPCPVSPEAKCRPCLLTRTVRNACLVHVEGDTMKTKQVTARANKAGAPGPPPSRRCAQAVQGKLKVKTQAHMEAETPPQLCPATPVTKTLVQMRPSASMTNTSPQTRPAAMMAKIPPQSCLLPSMIKSPTQTRPAATMTKAPPQMCAVPVMAKTPPQVRPAATMTKTPSHQTLQGVSVTKGPPAQTRLAAMVTKTPAQLGLVATILRTLFLPPPAARNLKCPSSAAAAAGIPDTSSHTCLSGPKAKAVVNARQAAGLTKVSPHSYLTERKVKCFAPSHLGAGDPKATARPPSEGEKIKAFSQKQVKTETASNISVAMEVPVVSSWSKVAGDRNKQTHLRTDVVKALSQAHVSTKLTKGPSQGHPPPGLTTALAQSHLGMCLSKVQSQAHLPTKLTQAQSQAHLATETAKSLHAARQAAELSSKTQSQPLLVEFKASTQPCQHVGALPRAKPEDRLTQLLSHSYVQGKATQGPRQGVSEGQNTLVPLLASAGHTTCNVESWGDRAQPSTTSPAPPCQEELAASQLASLCAELAALLGSQENLRALLAKALSQGEVRAALDQALSKEVLGATMAKALPQGILGTALVKALSWGKLATSLFCALSRGELLAEFTKAIQGRLVDVLSKALTEWERAILNQALCQGELGTVLSQSFSQVALRSGVTLPKAAAKTAGSGVTVMLTPVEVDCKGSPSAAWGPTLGPMRLQPSKGPEDAGVSGSQEWNSAIPSVAVGPRNSTAVPGGAWDVMAAVDPRQPGELVASVQAVEEIIIHAVVIIQACTRGFLVRHTIKLWHQWAVTIQAAWRGYRVRWDLTRLCRAATIIQAAWRGFCIRWSCTQQMLFPGMWAEMGSGARTTSDHRCFQSCQPRVCSLCQSLSSELGSPPSVVMFVGSSSRKCHICGHTLPTRVLHGTGQGAAGQASMPRGCITQSNPRSPWQPHHQNKAATAIQSAWRGFTVRNRLKQQQLAAKILQATWRSHCTRASLTTDALLGPAAWDNVHSTCSGV
ncbi:IQ domain-containing protein N [Mesoplodon densirostris]|uniref:IQ domain-containing protein N n=1 Tax=Mesoplodon densirostris TaxID=48708 RepID=UPI0028DB4D76|nr:IQ domain-containing protein N [Mesoplodon densirostris]